MKKLILIFFLLIPFSLVSGETSAAFSLPSSRSITWQGNVGVNGGIPARTTFCATITASSGDRTSTIQNAINNCPSGQVVKLGPGTFNVSGLTMKSNVTLRGSGIGVTTIAQNGNEFLKFGAYGIAYGTAVNLASGYTKGSTTITTSTNHGWKAGDHIVIDQLNNASGDPTISNAGDGGNSNMGGRTGDGSRAMQQVVKLVTPTSGTTATLEIPLYMTFDSGKTPQAAKVTMAVQNAGAESLTINNTAGYYYPIIVFNASNCWLKDIELNGTADSGMGIYLSASYRITISGSVIHQKTGGSASDNYGITTIGTGSAYLMENNAIYNVTNGIVLQGGASGCVFAYNYFTNLWQSVYPTANRYGMGFHGSHHMMNLFEGNVIDGAYFSSDNYWGSNSHNTIFKNRIVMNYSKVDQQLTLGLSQNQTYYNVIGNYLGTAGGETAYSTTSTPYAPSSKYVYAIASGAATSTLLRHGNWDGYTQGQKWCDGSGEPGCQGGSSDHALPDSLYLVAKPSWFCNEATFPAVNPAGSTDALRYSKIPAQIRYEGGSCTVPGVATYSLTVTSANGTVTSYPSGIICRSACSASYNSGTSVTLTAASDSGYTFAGWSGGSCSGTGTCTLILNSDAFVSATFVGGGNPTTTTSIDDGNSSGSDKGACFIATAAYGSYLDPHVITLREFRDKVLLTNDFGRKFVKFYYANSPAISRLIAQNDMLRSAARIALTPVVYAVAAPGAASMMFLSTILLVMFVKRNKRT